MQAISRRIFRIPIRGAPAGRAAHQQCHMRCRRITHLPCHVQAWVRGARCAGVVAGMAAKGNAASRFPPLLPARGTNHRHLPLVRLGGGPGRGRASACTSSSDLPAGAAAAGAAGLTAACLASFLDSSSTDASPSSRRSNTLVVCTPAILTMYALLSLVLRSGCIERCRVRGRVGRPRAGVVFLSTGGVRCVDTRGRRCVPGVEK